MESREADDVRGLVNIRITPGSGKPLSLFLCFPLDHYLCWSDVSQPGSLLSVQDIVFIRSQNVLEAQLNVMLSCRSSPGGAELGDPWLP